MRYPRKGTSWVLLRFPGGPPSPQSKRRASTPALASQRGYLAPPPLRVSVSPVQSRDTHSPTTAGRKKQETHALPLKPWARQVGRVKATVRGPQTWVRVPPVPLALAAPSRPGTNELGRSLSRSSDPAVRTLEHTDSAAAQAAPPTPAGSQAAERAKAGGRRAATDLLEGAAEEVDEREPEDQGEHPPLPEEPAPHHGRQVHHAGADEGRGGRGAEQGRPGARAAWPLHGRQLHSSQREPAPRPPAQPAPGSHPAPPPRDPLHAPPPLSSRRPPA